MERPIHIPISAKNKGTMRFRDKNFGKSPFDPDYIDDYDAQDEYDRYLDAVDEKYQWEKENR